MKSCDRTDNRLPKVILIGGSHHNGLGLARSFWVNQIKPYGIIVGEGSEKSFVHKSRCWQQTWAVDSPQAAVTFLLDHFSNEAEKPVIIPWADNVAAEIDKNLKRLKKYFIVPSFNEEQGAIVKWMDKQRQVEFAQKHDLLMAETWVISFPECVIPKDIIYPCIVKPVASFEGEKADIKKCDTEEELKKHLDLLRRKQYRHLLVQEFLVFDYEIVLCGCCGKDNAYLISKNLRIWPQVGGSSSFFQVIGDEFIHSQCERIVQALRKENYTGMFDIELFWYKNKVYLNEINWRNTGNSFLYLGTNVHCPVIWYLSQIGQSTNTLVHFSEDISQCAMNEATDLRHVVFANLSMRQWLYDCKKTQSFALWYWHDLKPTIAQYLHLTKELVLRLCKKKNKIG